MLTVAELREFISAPQVSDYALESLIQSAAAEISERVGPPRDTNNPLTVMLHGGEARLFLPQRADVSEDITISEVVGSVSTTLAADDYRVWHGGHVIVRLNDGTNPRKFWGTRATVTYVPVEDRPQRRAAIVDLVKLSLARSGYASESLGELQLRALEDYDAERYKVIRRLLPGGNMGVMA